MQTSLLSTGVGRTLSLFSDLDDELGRLEHSAPDQLWNARAIDDRAIADIAVSIVPGLGYVPDFISRDEELELVRQIDQMDWSNHWQRRTQYYGRRYLPADEVDPSGGAPRPAQLASRDRRLAAQTGVVDHLPHWAIKFRDRLVRQGVFEHAPNQMGINEYVPGQGIAPHVDYHGGEVVSITLITGCVMDFERVDAEDNRVDLFDRPTSASAWLPPRSMVVLKGEARTRWTHGIARRKKDMVDGLAIPRGRRISVTFRYIA